MSQVLFCLKKLLISGVKSFSHHVSLHVKADVFGYLSNCSEEASHSRAARQREAVLISTQHKRRVNSSHLCIVGIRRFATGSEGNDSMGEKKKKKETSVNVHPPEPNGECGRGWL